MQPTRFETPQTEDGVIDSISQDDDGRLVACVRFDPDPRFIERSKNLREHVKFVTRSRLARLGINLEVQGDIDFEREDGAAWLTASIASLVGTYPVEAHLPDLALPGLRVGRLVLCDPAMRLSSEAVHEATRAQELQLPAPLSIDANGRILIRPHRFEYDLLPSTDFQDLLGIVAREDGKAMLNRLQVPREVENIILEPGRGVITSCSMFLHKHFVLLDARSTLHGQHLESVILDPVTTRGSRIFLEITNSSKTTIVNPLVGAEVYRADEVPAPVRRWYGVADPTANPEVAPVDDYAELLSYYPDPPSEAPENRSYSDRRLGVLHANGRDERAEVAWYSGGAPKTGMDRAAARHPGKPTADERRAYRGLERIEPGAGATVLLEYFPNQSEHLLMCNAVVDGRVSRIVFRQASFEHGHFLSARDHGRLADYDAFGAEVIWCNQVFGEAVVHVYRRGRGFFVPFRLLNAFETSLVFAIYGSTVPLDPQQRLRLETLLTKLQRFFGGHVGFLTGGGPGAMEQAAQVAAKLGLLVGCNYLETVDQKPQESVDFYQTFQESARHFRQRWFDISSFHLFCIGGLGTLEEIGLTLTDMKLGLVEEGPLVFFGGSHDEPYWGWLEEQLHRIADERRGPEWLKTHVLMTNDPDEVVDFYARILNVGFE